MGEEEEFERRDGAGETVQVQGKHEQIIKAGKHKEHLGNREDPMLKYRVW